MRNRILLFLPAVAIFFSGCDITDEVFNAERIRGSGKVVQQTRDVSGFTEVRLAATGEMEIRFGSSESLTIEGEDNLLPRLQAEVENGKLTIRAERGVSLSPTVPIHYTLVVEELTALELSGSGKIHAAPVRSRDFSVSVPGSGDIRLDELLADTLTAQISGSGSIEVPGKVVSQRVRISGSGDYDGSNLQSNSADVSISGSGDMQVWVRDDLRASISGSGRVDYYGNPKISRHISGSGKVRNIGERP